MFEEKFGFFPKKKVSYDGRILKIKNESIPAKDIKRVYFQPFDFSSNDWGAMYFSLTGAENVEVINNREVKFTKGQTEKALELLELLDIEVVNRSRTDVTETNPFSNTNIESKVSNVNVCPNCSSANIQFIENKKKNFSVGKAAGGALLTGGIGTLAGFAGKKGKKDMWHCKNCGNTFELERK